MSRDLVKLCVATCCLYAARPSKATTYYVNASASSGGNGLGWTTAYNDLQQALSVASGGDDIWVAEGTYYPSVEYCVDTCASTSRNYSFSLVNGVKIYGGFVGTETDLPQRNPELNETILSGDINQPGLLSDNCFHVVTAHNVGAGTMLNGFTITGGNADNSSSSLSQAGEGGGMLVAFGDTGGSSPRIVRCKFIANFATGLSSASGAGGAVFVEWQGTESGPPVQFVNCAFIDNIALHAGGAGYVNGALAGFTNCVFRGNSVLDNTVGSGGALAAKCALGLTVDSCDGPLITVINSTIVENYAKYGSALAAVTNLNPTIAVKNSILWSNDPNETSPASASVIAITYSDIQGSFTWPGAGNINADPLFCDEGAGILRLSDTSPCIDAGLDATRLPMN